ncbi:hypothetical protein pdam_00013217 [Pocillopora damicornis]|uniref:Uncharacterized protein n=1 Tax=Pocillopora damicornis TaxID=46731 RepID=A0A3M6UAR3_POCDA|nr:hypothetical protein pdam_00013217 [Pocillopora damicornis]
MVQPVSGYTSDEDPSGVKASRDNVPVIPENTQKKTSHVEQASLGYTKRLIGHCKELGYFHTLKGLTFMDEADVSYYSFQNCKSRKGGLCKELYHIWRSTWWNLTFYQLAMPTPSITGISKYKHYTTEMKIGWKSFVNNSNQAPSLKFRIQVKHGRLEVIKQSSFSAYGDDTQIFYANKEAMKI